MTVTSARRTWRPLVSVSAAICLMVTAAAADELHLKNGDRFTGTVEHLVDGTLTFKTAHGTLAVPWSEVTTLTIEEEIIVTTTAGDALTFPGGSIEVPATVGLERPMPALVVSGGTGAGFVATSGNTSVNSLRLDGDAVVRMRANRYTFSAGINRAEDRGVTTAQSWTASGRYDRFVSTRMFINGNAIFTNDRFRDIHLRSAYGIGLGYQVIDRPLIKFNLDAGVGYVNEAFTVAPDDSYAALRESAKLDVVAIPDRVVLFHQHDGYFGVTGDDNLFVQTQNGVRFTVVAGLITTIRVDLDYDRSPSPGRANVDRTMALTLGYRF